MAKMSVMVYASHLQTNTHVLWIPAKGDRVCWVSQKGHGALTVEWIPLFLPCARLLLLCLSSNRDCLLYEGAVRGSGRRKDAGWNPWRREKQTERDHSTVDGKNRSLSQTDGGFKISY